MNKTKIDWCSHTLNPVVGCPNGCEYCYARKQNNRFHWVADFSKPEFFPDRLKELKSKKPKSIFIDSVSDIGCWPYEYFKPVMNAMWANPQHSYIVLTKNPTGLYILFNKYFSFRLNSIREIHEFEKFFESRLYVGATLDGERQLTTTEENNIRTMDFLSVEPLRRPVAATLKEVLPGSYIRVVIIGAETGNSKNKVIPQKEWITDIVKLCRYNQINVFMKESLRKIMGEDFIQDTLPWDLARYSMDGLFENQPTTNTGRVVSHG